MIVTKVKIMAFEDRELSYRLFESILKEFHSNIVRASIGSEEKICEIEIILDLYLNKEVVKMFISGFKLGVENMTEVISQKIK